ncbi:hypothetical protein Dsin_013372 [Dipteronia sinensis]|uniref:Reverse transcriptase domain-containing protein n=1 Tax=Dipteronia sinensis TaxID=43782 RepID=A0AAE0AL21_9ROSI|nr:hypothetical protein Dsin_013372 [Dipteronia sinensis]
MIGEEHKEWGPSLFRFVNSWLQERGLMKEAMVGWKESMKEGSKGMSLAAKVKESKCRIMRLWGGLRKEEQCWRQKLRVKWLKEGDKNSKLFHVMANGRRRMNRITEIVLDGVKVTEPDKVKEGVVRFFKDHYENVKWNRLKIKGLKFKQISDSENSVLEGLFSTEEVRVAVGSCDGNKAPGHDGLNLNFIKANWEVIEEDFMKFIHEFHVNGSIVKDLNHSFLALIPKEEIIHSWKKDNEGGLLVKLDFEKAYNYVDHSFLDSVLEDMGFGSKWRNWVKCCISTPAMSVLVNGSLT